MVAAALAIHHAFRLAQAGTTDLEFVAALSFVWLCLITVVPYWHRDVTAPEAGSSDATRLARLRLCVIVPVMNEDETMFANMLDSIAAQSRLPARVHVVENGTPAPTLRDMVDHWALTVGHRFEVLYSHTVQPGKRAAQAIAIRQDPDADVYATIDSDVRLESTCFERALYPFRRRRTMSVAGVMVGDNTRHNLLTRLLELGYVCSFLNGRAAYSMVRSVNVNCGGLAFYRGHVIRHYLTHYLTHTVAGRLIQYGDDAMLTRYAAREGDTIMQLGAVGWTLHPVHLSHLTRQRVRWWRSFFWGSVWLLRWFKPTHPIWWITVANVARSVLYVGALGYVIAALALGNATAPWLFLVWVVGVSYLQTSRYLVYPIIPGVRMWRRAATWLLAPLAGLLSLYLGPVLQVYGAVTCLRTGWGTRQQVEVRADVRTGEYAIVNQTT